MTSDAAGRGWRRATRACGPRATSSANRLGWLDSPRSMLDQATRPRELRRQHRPGHDRPARHGRLLARPGGARRGRGQPRRPSARAPCRRLRHDRPRDGRGLAARGRLHHRLVEVRHDARAERAVLLRPQPVADPARYAVITDPGTPLAVAGGRARHPAPVREPARHRRPLLGALVLRPRARPRSWATTSPSCASAPSTSTGRRPSPSARTMGRAALAGRDKTTIVVDENVALVRPLGRAAHRRVDRQAGPRLSSRCRRPRTSRATTATSSRSASTTPAELGAEFFRFELAIAIAGHVLEVDPFDEPNVAESKANTTRVLGAPAPAVACSRRRPRTLMALIAAEVRPRRLRVAAGLPPLRPGRRARGAAPAACATRNGGMAVTAGYGPSFLHSTGQLHKGGPNSVVAVQLVRARAVGRACRSRASPTTSRP